MSIEEGSQSQDSRSEERLKLALDAVGGGVFDWRSPIDEWVRGDLWYELTATLRGGS